MREKPADKMYRLTGYAGVYTAAEVAAMMKVSKMTVFRLCEERQIAHFRVGLQGLYRIPVAAIDEYMNRYAVA